MIYEGTKSERFSRVREALEDLGHEVKDLDLLAAGSFLSDLTNGGIGALYDATDGRGDGSKALARLSESLRIPLLRDGYCYQYLGYLLNRGSVGDAIFRRGYGTGH
ncbi:MAG: hypothetical protein LBH60_03290 [Prevotellaceae bacterium]|nr:hypothetical protein [Prevotellaceae bacterium]